MADLIFPLQYKRQYSAPVDIDMVFKTTAKLQIYLTSPRRYSGQTVTCLDQEGKIFILNNSLDTWLTVSASGSSPTISGTSYNKVSFGNIITSTYEYPITYGSSIGHGMSIRFFNHLKNHFSDHNKFLFDVTYENGTQFLAQQFQNTDELISFLNIHTPHNGMGSITSPYIVECYAKQVPEVGAISKIRGINTFYSCLKGNDAYRQNYRTTYTTLYVNGGGFVSKREDFLTKIWDYFLFPGFINLTNIEFAARATWFPQTPTNMYGLLSNGNQISFTSGQAGDRWSFNWGDSSFAAHGINTMIVTDSVTLGLNLYTNEIIVFDSMKDDEYYANYSFIKIYKIEGIDGMSDNRTALFVKPIGQDVFRLNYIPNISNKFLYVIYYEGDNNHQPVIRRLNINARNDIIGDLSYMIKKTDWNLYPELVSTNARVHIGHTKQKKFRFFIGDDNGNISQFSPEVAPFCFRSGAKIKTMIRSL